jgi:hypothetical protein
MSVWADHRVVRHAARALDSVNTPSGTLTGQLELGTMLDERQGSGPRETAKGRLMHARGLEGETE